MPRIGPDPNFEEKVDELLSQYAREKARLASRKKMLISSSLVGLFSVGIYETLTFGTTRVVAVETALMASILIAAMAIGYSIFLFWLGWNYGDYALKKGFTCIQFRHVGLLVFLSACAASPFAAMMLSEERSGWGAGTLFAVLFWINTSALVTGYGSKVYSETKRLF